MIYFSGWLGVLERLQRGCGQNADSPYLHDGLQSHATTVMASLNTMWWRVFIC